MSINEIDYIDDLGAAGVLALTHKLVVAATGSKVLKVTTLADVLTALALTASIIANVPAGNIAATNVQAALNELDTEKAALAGATFTGAILLPDGSASTPALAFASDPTTGLYYVSPGLLKFASSAGVAGSDVMQFGPNGIALNKTVTGGLINVSGEGGIVGSILVRYGNDTTSPSTDLRKGRGTIAVPATIATNDLFGALNFRGYGATAFVICATADVICTETSPSDTAMGAQFRIRVNPIGSASRVTVLTVDNESGIKLINNAVINQNRVFLPRSYTVATVPTVTSTGLIHVSDEGGGATLAFSDGSNWRRVRDHKIIATTNTTTVEFEGSVAANIQSLVPLTGFSQAIPNGCRTYVVAPAGTIAAGTLTMPSAPRDGQQLTLCTTQVITGLTMNAAGGQTLLGALTAATANGFASWTYKASTTTWYRSG